MKYTTNLRDNDFDFFLYNLHQTLIFFASKVSYNEVSLLFLEGTCKHYLVFSTMSGFTNVLIDLPVQQHFDLLEALRIFND